MAQAPHEDGELTGRDGAFVFLVEDGEEFLIVNELFLGQSFEGGTFHHFLKYYSRVLYSLGQKRNFPQKSRGARGTLKEKERENIYKKSLGPLGGVLSLPLGRPLTLNPPS